MESGPELEGWDEYRWRWDIEDEGEWSENGRMGPGEAGVESWSVDSDDWLARDVRTGLFGLPGRRMSGDSVRSGGTVCRQRSIAGAFADSGDVLGTISVEGAPAEESERLEPCEYRDGRLGPACSSGGSLLVLGGARVTFVHSSESVVRSMAVTRRKSRRLRGTPPWVL